MDKSAVLMAVRDGKPSGDQIKAECPQCHRASLYYSPASGKYLCFRATCSLQPGCIKKGVSGSANQYKPSLHNRTQHLFMTRCTDLHAPSKYLDCISYPVWYVPSIRRVAYELHTRLGVHNGWLLRSYVGDTPKALIAAKENSLHYPKHRWKDETKVVLVEDIISAEKLTSLGYPSVALLGVHITYECMEHLYNAGVRDVTLALDNDASAVAVRLAQKLGWFNTSVKLLKKDPKDSTPEELKEIFG